MAIVCNVCNDTHRMTLHGANGDSLRDREVSCTFCPTPCESCRQHLGAFCVLTPCPCKCHAGRVPATVTEPLPKEREADIRSRAALWPEAMADAAVLLTEIDRLRALPVLRTCGECRFHSSSVAAMAGPFHNVVGGDYCSHERAKSDDCDPDDAPPEWCPLRGAR